MLNGPALFKLSHHHQHQQFQQDPEPLSQKEPEEEEQKQRSSTAVAIPGSLDPADCVSSRSSSSSGDSAESSTSALPHHHSRNHSHQHHAAASPFLAAAAAAAAAGSGNSTAAAAAAVAAAASGAPPPTPFLLGTQQFLLTPPPPGVQLMTIPVSLAALPGSNQIPVIATSTGQLILANIVNVPHSATNFMGSAAAAAFAAQQLLAAAAASNSVAASQTPSAPVPTSAESPTPPPEAADDRQTQQHSEPSAGTPMEQDAEIGYATVVPASSASVPDESGEDETNKHTVSQITDANVVDGVDLEDIRDFAKQFKLRRLSLGLTQTQVGAALSAAKGPAYSQSAICRFEKLDITPKSAAKIKPVLESWMAEAEEKFHRGSLNGLEDNGGQLDQSCMGLSPSEAAKKLRKRRTSFTPTALEILNEYFEQNTHPTGAQMTELARSLRYEREVIRVWFCNKRQALKNTIKRLQRPQEPAAQHHHQNHHHQHTSTKSTGGRHSSALTTASVTTSMPVSRSSNPAVHVDKRTLPGQHHLTNSSVTSLPAVVSPFTYRESSSHDNCANMSAGDDASPVDSPAASTHD